MRPRVVIVGGGFGGLYAARSLKHAAVDVTLIDRRNFHLFQPLLYQVATGALSPGEIASPLRYVLNRQKNTRVLLAEVMDIDVDKREVVLNDHSRVPYDTVIFATGATHSYFGHPEWEPFAPGLKTVEDATEIRTRVLLAFERAERITDDPQARHASLTFVIVGGGPTGVELAGAIAEISRDTLKKDFRSINPADANIFLIEGTDRLLPTYPPKLSRAAERALIKLGVHTRTGAMVTGIDEHGVAVKSGNSVTEIPARTVLWAAGVAASPIGKMLSDRLGLTLDKAGRVPVEPDLSVAGHPELLVIGDLAAFLQDGKQVPGVAPTAIQQGHYAAKLITSRLRNENPKPFRYFDKGSLATIGRNQAVAEIGPFQFSGILAWLAWLFIHLLYIVEFENRLLIVVQWAYDYFTHNRGARLITGEQQK
jgi:NADH:ubiquinone reductase (H+-translocating)